METNSKKLLEGIPDFREFMELAEEIRKLSFEKMMIEKTIREAEADTFRTVMTNPKYFVNGKAVPVSYYDNAFKHSGLGGELLGYRQDLAEVVSTLESKRMT